MTQFELAAAFTVPAALAWTVVALLMSWVTPSGAALTAALVFAAAYGITQLTMIPVPVPTLPFGTPSSWLRGRGSRAQAAIWGATLGPGFATRNPYAGMWLAVLALGVIDPVVHASVVGCVAGAGHGFARSVGIALNIRRRATPFEVMAARMHWRLVDGVALIGAAGVIVGASLPR